MAEIRTTRNGDYDPDNSEDVLFTGGSFTNATIDELLGAYELDEIININFTTNFLSITTNDLTAYYDMNIINNDSIYFNIPHINASFSISNSKYADVFYAASGSYTLNLLHPDGTYYLQ